MSRHNPITAFFFVRFVADNFQSLIGQKMVQETDRIAVGTRFKMSNLGAARFPELAGKVGIVVELSHRTTGITVLFDSDRRPTVLHRDYITPNI